MSKEGCFSNYQVLIYNIFDTMKNLYEEFDPDSFLKLIDIKLRKLKFTLNTDIENLEEETIDKLNNKINDFNDLKKSFINNFDKEAGLFHENYINHNQYELDIEFEKEEHIEERIVQNSFVVPEYLLEILKDKELFSKITEMELDKKIVKEIPTRKTIFLCAQGRLVENCQTASYNLLINDDAGAGKDYVTGKTLEIIPKEQYIKRTRISPTVFTYWHNSEQEPDWTWDGKVFYTEDISEPTLNSEVFKVMCSAGSKATIIIKQKAVDLEIIGKPVMITTTATAVPNPELTRRFEIVNLDESIDQTKEIMKRHCNYAITGVSPEYNQNYIEAMKYLKRVKVKIPFAKNLYLIFPARNVMMRTKFPRFLDLIRASAAFHQYQRKIDIDGFFIAEKQDYDIASEIMQKLVSNKYLVSLTKNQKRIVQFFEKYDEIKLPASKVREAMHNFISLPAMQTNLSLLTDHGILKATIEDGSRGDVEMFKLNEDLKDFDGIKFPSYEELIK